MTTNELLARSNRNMAEWCRKDAVHYRGMATLCSGKEAGKYKRRATLCDKRAAKYEAATAEFEKAMANK